MAKQRRWVVKAGSKMVCDGGALLIRAWMQQVRQLREKHKIQIIWVTSGAIAWAAERTQFNGKNRTLAQKQALSAIGQPLIMDQYNLALQTTGLLGSQVLLSADDMAHKMRRLNLLNTLNELLKWGVIPILNENDAVATAEIQFGDNDTLASRVAIHMGAEKLVLLTDVEGFFTANPATHPNAEMITHRSKISAQDLKMTRGRSTSSVGTGGMYSKLLAARAAHQRGIVTHLVKGDRANNLLDIAAGRPLGTQIGGKP